MSKPQNPLNLFRTYSYHHILIACDGTDTAEELATVSEITAFDHERAEKKFCPQRVPGGRGKYVVLINGMSDTQFTVLSATWTSVLIPNQGAEESGEGSAYYRTMAVDGELKIQEPLGVNFLNVLNEVTKSLGTDPNGVCFVLKTVFVGHRDNGTSEIIPNVRPLLFMAFDISAIFDVTGAEYIFSLVGIVNGAARLPHQSAIGQDFSFEIPEGSTIGKAFELLQDELNGYYGKYLDQLQVEAECNDLDFDRTDFIEVEYRILVHPDYAKLPVGTASPASQQTKGNDDPIVEVTGKSASIEKLIDIIMRTSQEVIEEDQKPAAERHMFKITSTLKTGPEKYIVEYEVQRYKAVLVGAEELFTFEPPLDANGNPQGIEFDYIFTGKNIDVTSFDIKMQMGMAFLQTLNVSSSIPTNSNEIINHFNRQSLASGTGTRRGPGDQQEGGGCLLDERNNDPEPVKRPIFLGQSVTESTIRNKRFATSAQNYNAILSRHAAYENIEARMTIRGNPQLLEETTQLPSYMDPTIPLDEASAAQKPGRINVPDEERLPEELRNRPLMSEIHRTPGYVKVNVFMPNSSLIDTASDLHSADFAQNFWYQGWYFLYAINHSFEDGDFTQELEMFSLPTEESQHELNKTREDCSGSTTESSQSTTTGTAPTTTTSENVTQTPNTGDGGDALEQTIEQRNARWRLR